MSEKAPDPRRVDLPSLARHAGMLEGDLPQAGLKRLALSLLSPEPGAPDSPMHWRATAELRPQRGGGEPELWLHLKVDTVVSLECQRCLQPMRQPLTVDRLLRFVRDEVEAARLDEESEHDVLVLPASLDLIELLEDELILALPLVPRHDICPQPLPMSVADPGAHDDADDEPHPFAALASLRRPEPS
jgi:uncharacterized protein